MPHTHTLRPQRPWVLATFLTEPWKEEPLLGYPSRAAGSPTLQRLPCGVTSPVAWQVRVPSHLLSPHKTWVGVPIAVFPGCALLRGLLCMSAQATRSPAVSVTEQTSWAAGVLSAPGPPALGTLRAESDLRSLRPRPRAARHDT